MATKAYAVKENLEPSEMLANAAASLAGRDLCSIADFSIDEVAAVMELAHAMKASPADYRFALDAKQMVMFFEKASLRTRLTFEAGMNTLGGSAMFVDQTQSPLGERESLADIARNVERWVSLIVLRTYAHETITEMAEGHPIAGDQRAERSRASVPGLGRLHDSRRALWQRTRPEIRFCGRRQQRLPLAHAGGRADGRGLHGGTPRSYAPKAEIVAQARKIGEQDGKHAHADEDPAAAVRGADAVDTDACTSMGFEHEATKRAPLFKPYQVNEALMSLAAPRAVFMHCLPAHRNAEVTDAVMDGPQSVRFDQAENRMHAQKALMVLLLGGSLKKEKTRKGARRVSTFS